MCDSTTRPTPPPPFRFNIPVIIIPNQIFLIVEFTLRPYFRILEIFFVPLKVCPVAIQTSEFQLRTSAIVYFMIFNYSVYTIEIL